jgi:hypothetical protein
MIVTAIKRKAHFLGLESINTIDKEVGFHIIIDTDTKKLFYRRLV